MITTSSDVERITHFNEGEKFKATNPEVGDDWKCCFYGCRLVEGIGHGTHILDVKKYEKMTDKRKLKKETIVKLT